MALRTQIEQDIVRALAPLQDSGLYIVDCPEDSAKANAYFDRGQVSVGWFAETTQQPQSIKVVNSPVTQTHQLQFQVLLELQDASHRLAADCVDQIEELVTGLVPTGQQHPLYFVRAGFLQLDEHSIWHYAVIFGFQLLRQTHVKEAA